MVMANSCVNKRASSSASVNYFLLLNTRLRCRAWRFSSNVRMKSSTKAMPRIFEWKRMLLKWSRFTEAHDRQAIHDLFHHNITMDRKFVSFLVPITHFKWIEWMKFTNPLPCINVRECVSVQCRKIRWQFNMVKLLFLNFNSIWDVKQRVNNKNEAPYCLFEKRIVCSGPKAQSEIQNFCVFDWW